MAKSKTTKASKKTTTASDVVSSASSPDKVVDGSPAVLPTLGKKFKGQKFVTIKTSEMVEAETKLNQKYAGPNAVTLTAYFVHRSIRNPVQQASMAAYTKVKRATVQDFDKIFEKF